MPIPNDDQNRWWVDASSANPEKINSLRPSLIAFLAFDHNRIPSIAGSGFIIAGMPDYALVISAKHVLLEMVFDIQQPVKKYDTSSPFIPKSFKMPSLEPTKLKSIWMGSENADLLNTAHANFNDSLDIVDYVITPQESHTQSFKPVSIPIDINVPSIGEVVHMVTLDGMEVTEIKSPNVVNGTGQLLQIKRRVNIRVGVVTNIYPQGFRQYKWPCFTTSIPAIPGMSGGFVTIPREGETIAACGIVCADNSINAAYNDYFQCGESVVACAWTALCLNVPITIPSSPDPPTRTIYQMMQDGDMDKAIGDIENIEVIDLGNGDYTIKNRKG